MTVKCNLQPTASHSRLWANESHDVKEQAKMVFMHLKAGKITVTSFASANCWFCIFIYNCFFEWPLMNWQMSNEFLYVSVTKIA